MYYGYGKETAGWIGRRKHQLAIQLSNMLQEQNFLPDDEHANYTPYIQSGADFVVIRRITHLSEDDQDKLVMLADQIYKQLMEATVNPTLNSGTNLPDM